jgi:hypothetical protein
MSESHDDKDRYFEIDTGARRRWAGLAGYVVIFATVAVATVLVFLRFTGSLLLAIGLVAFMIAYMVGMAVIASKHRGG